MDVCDELEAKLGTVHSGAFDAMRRAKQEIEGLRSEIASLRAYSERLNVENNELLAEVSACSDLALRLDSAAPDAAGAFSGTPSERIGRQIARLLVND